MVLELLDISSLINDFHYVLSSFLIVDSVDAGLWEAFGELLHDVIASLHDFSSWEGLNFQEGIT